MNTVLRRGILPLSGFVIIIFIWWLLSATGLIGPQQLPPPNQVFAATIQGFTNDQLWLDVQLSLFRVLMGVAIGSLLAIPVGFVLAWYPRLRAMFSPLINFFRALPPIALIPLVIVYLGIGENARITILIYAAFFASVVVISEGVAAIDDVYIRAARSMGATQFEMFKRVVIPLTLPQVLVGVRVALGVSWATLVAAELIAAQRGLGAMIQNAANFFQMDLIYAGIIIIGLVALIMDWLLGLLMKRLVRWQERADT